MVEYKVAETSIVTDDQLEGIINEWVGRGWFFDGIHFVIRESSRRPSMAFLLFTREKEGKTED
jgi:hypothetical protein